MRAATPGVSTVRSTTSSTVRCVVASRSNLWRGALLVGLIATVGCSHRHARPPVTSVEPRGSVHDYVATGQFAKARQVAFRNLDDARDSRNPSAIARAELDVGEVMMRLGEHETARRYLFAVDGRGSARERQTARAFLALSYHRAMEDALARTYFERLEPTLVSPRVWPEVERAFGSIAPRVVRADVQPRTAWGAAPFRATNADPMGPITRITVHHTAIAADTTSIADATSQMRSIQRTHFARGWAGIGYHYIIDSAGRIWEARPIAYQGAHAGNHELNRGNIGVSLMGDFEQHHVPKAQQDACAQLLLDLCSRHGVRPDEVKGHCDLKHTQCPGAHLARLLAELTPTRTAIAQAKRGHSVPIAASGGGVRHYHTVVRGDTLSRIARRYGVTLTALRRANPGTSDGLYPGNLIAVP